MLKKVLFIGCGGSGLRTLRRLQRELLNRMESVGLGRDDFPDAWQFVTVDVPSDEQLEESLRGYGNNDYVGLAGTGVPYLGPGGVDEVLGSREGDYRDFAQWRPDPDLCRGIAITKGAGQWRAVGRAASAFSVQDVMVPSLEAACQRMLSSASDDQLLKVAQALGVDSNEVDTQFLTIIVTSLGGGAGSGIYLDVADALRSLNFTGGGTFRDESFGILYDPSIFAARSNLGGSGITGNTLGALSELTAGRFNPWSGLTYVSGILGGSTSRGPAFPFLIGATNGQIDLLGGADASQGSSGVDRVYEMVATMLTNIVTDPDVTLFDNVIGNWGAGGLAAPSAPAILDNERTNPIRPVSSMGFAKVTLGRDRFVRYASERQTRELLDRMLNGHMGTSAAARSKSDGKSVDEMVAARIGVNNELDRGLLDVFLAEAGLSERTESQNQIIDAIRGGDGRSDSPGLNDPVTAVEAMLSKLQDPKKHPLDVQFNTVWQGNSYVSGVPGRWQLDVVRTQLAHNAQAWAKEIQPRILDLVTRWVAEHGLLVTSKIVEMVRAELGTVVPTELRAEAVTEGKTDLSNIEGVVNFISETKIRSAIPRNVTAKLKGLVRLRMECIAERDLREITADLLEDMAVNFFDPLLFALGGAHQVAQREVNSDTFKALASVTVPAGLVPPANEILLEPWQEYPDTYLALLASNDGSGTAQRSAFAGEIGPETRRSALPDSLRPWKITDGGWVPDLSRFGVSREPTPGPLDVNLAYGLDQVMRRCRSWWFRDEGSTGAYVRQTVRDWVLDNTNSDAEKLHRAGILGAKLKQAFTVAHPFAALNPTWLQSFQSDEKAVLYYSADRSIPLVINDGQALYQAIDTQLAGFAANATRTGWYYAPTQNAVANQAARSVDATPARDINVFAYYTGICSSVVASLTGPVVSSFRSMGSNKADHDPDLFWRMRRTRPLLEAIPLTHASRLSLMRGWITARLLDVITIDHKKQTCTVTEDGQKYTFLKPPLGNPESPWDWIGMILESALLSLYFAAEGDDGPLEAMNALLRLGNSDGTTKVDAVYDKPAPVLVTATPPGLKNFGPKGDVPADVATALERTMDDFSKYEVAMTRTGKYTPVKYATQLAPLAIEAMQQLLDASDQIGNEDTGPKAQEPLG